MGVDGTIARARAAWARHARATCVVTRPGTDSYDYGTFANTEGAGTEVYSGWCHLTPETESVRDVEAGGELKTTPRYTLTVAADIDVHVDDLVVVTATYDGDLTGRTLHVVSVESDTWQAGRRVVVQDDIGGE